MRFLVDECTGPRVARWLREQGYDVVSVYEQARGMDDDSILEKANKLRPLLPAIIHRSTYQAFG